MASHNRWDYKCSRIHDENKFTTACPYRNNECGQKVGGCSVIDSKDEPAIKLNLGDRICPSVPMEAKPRSELRTRGVPLSIEL